MPISQTTITGSIKTPSGGDAQITEISFKLSGSDFEAGELIAANTTLGTVTTASGDFTVDLWPNEAGLDGTTTYSVALKFSDGSTVTNMPKIFVPISETHLTIEDLAFISKAMGTVKGYSVVVLTPADYAGLAPKAPRTIYIVVEPAA